MAAVLLVVQMGCASMSDIRQLRELPGVATARDQDQYEFDQSVGVYRLKAKPPAKGEVARDSSGRKIRTEDQLRRWIEASTSVDQRLWGKGMTTTGIVLAVIYVPVGIVVVVVESVVAIPVGIYVAVLKNRMEQNSKSDYEEGHRQFNAGHYEMALAEWDRAIAMMPSLRAFSDIEYWRGRAFEASGDRAAARTAYMDFLNYSERSTPVYFQEVEPKGKLSWAEKASDAETRVAALQTMIFK